MTYSDRHRAAQPGQALLRPRCVLAAAFRTALGAGDRGLSALGYGLSPRRPPDASIGLAGGA
jgi:hypothetical protein